MRNKNFCSCKILYMNIYSSFICNHQKLEKKSPNDHKQTVISTHLYTSITQAKWLESLLISVFLGTIHSIPTTKIVVSLYEYTQALLFMSSLCDHHLLCGLLCWEPSCLVSEAVMPHGWGWVKRPWDHKPLWRQNLSSCQGCSLCPLYFTRLGPEPDWLVNDG